MVRNQQSDRMNEVSNQLRDLYRKMGELKGSETTNRAQTYKNEMVQGTSAAATHQLADVHSASHTAEIQKTQGEIYALEEERDHLRFMVKYGMEAK